MGVSPEELRSSLVSRFTAARSAGDVDEMVAAALELPSVQSFGTHPGQIPSLLHEAYLQAATASPATRARLAAALARAWVYGGEADRAAWFAQEAQRAAAEAGDPALTAAALDAALLVAWGPDRFEDRRRLAARLAEVAAHLTDVEARLSAAVWRLVAAWECLDMVAVQRQLRALDLLADESGSARVGMFAASRRAMRELAVGDPGRAEELASRAVELGSSAGAPDAVALGHELAAQSARMRGDREAIAGHAAAFDAHGRAEGIPSIAAEGAILWLAAGEHDRAEATVRFVAGDSLALLPRDVDFLLTVSSVVAVASELGFSALASEGAGLLEPYAGRAVINAGAVGFHGVVDDYLYRAHRATGAEDPSRWRDAAISAYRRVGAGWWIDQLGSPAVGRRGGAFAAPATSDMVMYPCGPGVWSVGRADEPVTMSDLRGLGHLRYLLGRPSVDVSALDLTEAAAGHAGTGIVQHDLGPTLDVEATDAYRRRLEELDAEADAADRSGDAARSGRIAAERSALLAELASATGLGGRRRRSGATDERARVAVRRTIASTLERIEQQDPFTARLLRDTIRTGTFCRYEPDPTRPVSWILQPPSP